MPKNSSGKEFNPNPEQKAVIDSKEKHLLVVAGAGSGKTATMVERICKVIRDGAKPQSVLGLTFTRKASHELAKRAANRLKEEENEQQGSIRVQTYDSFIQGIVRQYGLLIRVDPQMVPLSDAGINQCIAEVLENNYEKINAFFGEIESIDSNFSLPYVHPLSQAYSSKDLQDAVKKFTAQTLNFLVDENHLDFKSAAKEAEKWSKDWHDSLQYLNAKAVQDEEKKRINQLLCNAKLRELVVDLSLKYYQLREENNLAEYGDFTLYALKLIHDYPSIAEEYRKRFRYVFLDEYQDTNHTQGILIKLLFENGPAVTAVGDPQQAIYGFRGTTPGAFDYFKSAFKDVKQLNLPETFRNKENIVDLANHITERLPEKDRLSLRSREEGGKVCALIYKNKEGQNEELGPKAALKFIIQKREENPYGTIAILGRDNQDLLDYQKILDENKIPCILTGKSEFDNKNPIARDFKEILAVATDPFASRQAEDLLLSPRYSLSLQDMYKVAGKVSSKNKDMNPDKDKEHPDPVFTLPIYLRSLDEMQIRELLPSKDAGADRKSGIEILTRFVRNVKSVESASFSGLESAVTEAWKALDLNADVAIANELLGSLPYEKLTLEDALEAVKSYKADLESDQSPTVQGFLGWIENYQKDFRPKDSEESRSKEAQPPVELMTIHQAKGLEWDTVIIVGMQNELGKQNQDKDSPSGNFENGQIPTIGKESMWINSFDAVPANLRTDLDDCDPEYAKACQPFAIPSQLSSDALLECLEDLYREEINKNTQEEAHVAYVALTRPKGDLLLISRCPQNLFSKNSGIANVSMHGGLFWGDAVKFILGSDGEFEGQVLEEVKKHNNFAVFSNDEDLKSLVEEANQNGENKEEEVAKNWPVQIEEGLRQNLQKGARKVEDAPKEGEGGELYRKARNLLEYEKTRKEHRQKLVEHLNLVSTTALQKLSINGDLKDFIRPMPSHPSPAAEAGTQFHAWIAAYLWDRSEAEKVRIDEKYENKISCWKRTFKCSDWSKRTCMGTEVPYCISLDRGDLSKIVVTTKLDAVFEGDLDGNCKDGDLTVVDWKTGRAPTGKSEKCKKLFQLDVYRLALSRVLHKDLSSIHACLYYVSDGGKQIDAEDKSEEKIVDEILKADRGELEVFEDENPEESYE